MEFPQKINFGSFDDWRFNQQQEQKYTIGHNILELYRAEPRKNAPADNENLMIAMHENCCSRRSSSQYLYGVNYRKL